MEKTLISIIKTYQYLTREIMRNNIFPIFRSECRFYPSCSDYALEAINKYGPIHGSAKSVNRIFRCNPLSEARVDEP